MSSTTRNSIHFCLRHSLALPLRELALVGAVEELAVEELHRDDGEDELHAEKEAGRRVRNTWISRIFSFFSLAWKSM